MIYRGVVNSTLSLVIDRNFPDEILFWGIMITSASLSGMIQSARWVWEPLLAARFGRWSDGSSGRLPLFILTLLIACVSFILVPLKLPLFLWLIITIVLMLCATSLTTLTDSLTSDIAKNSQSTISIMTLYSVANDLGAAMGPLISYFIIDNLKYGLYLSYQGCAVLFLLITFLWYKPFKEKAGVKVSKT